MAARGDAVRIQVPPFHLWIILTNPDASGSFVFVNITSAKKNGTDDPTCPIVVGDHPAIRHESYIRYKDAFEANTRGMAVNPDKFHQEGEVTPQALKRIIEGALQSTVIPNEIKDIVRQSVAENPID